MGINEKIKIYIDEVCGYIKNNKVHEEIKKELSTHIEDIIFEYEVSGISEEEAIDKALKHMGGAKEVGSGLNKVHKTKPDWIMIILTALLINLGLIVMYFIEKSQQNIIASGDLWMRSMIYILIGIAIIFGTYFLDYRNIKKYSKYTYFGTIVLFLVSFIFSGYVNGARQWIILGRISINFVQLSLFMFIISIAGIFDNYNWNGRREIIKGTVILLFPNILMLFVPSFVSCVVYTISAFTIMLLSGMKIKNFLLLIGGCFGIFFISVISEPYRIARMLGFMNPTKDPEGAGWIYNQLVKVREASGLFGNGVNSNMNQLPEIHTDFVLSYIMYTFGWIVVSVVVAVIVVFLIRMIGIAKSSKDSYGKLLISGFIAMLTVEFLWNILMNLGLAPAMGVSMPFISYGGSTMVINMAVVGLVINVYKLRTVPVKSIEE